MFASDKLVKIGFWNPPEFEKLFKILLIELKLATTIKLK